MIAGAGAAAALMTLAPMLAWERGAAAPPGAPAGAPDAGASGTGAAAAGADALTPNQVCLAGLRQRQVAFVEWPTKGIRTPVRILGPLGALSLRIRDRRPTTTTESGAANVAVTLMDCELARALLDASPAFRALGVRELLFSGIYQYRTRRRSTKLSEHAHGLAIDVHAFVLDATREPRGDGPTAGEGEAVADVARDFEAQVGVWTSTSTSTSAPAITEQDACVGHPRTPKGRLLRTLACRLRASSVFREVITPDDNADHYNHFHLEAFPDALSRTRAVLAHRSPVIDD